MTTYGSVCSGIEAASVAWEPLGWQPAWFAEIDKQPAKLLTHHYPKVPNFGDMTKLSTYVTQGIILAPDILVGGTPCQSFSVAGLRKGMTDPRGQLTISFCQLGDSIDAKRKERNEPECVIVWENVPGVLSDKANAFGCFIATLAGESEELKPPGRKWSNAGCVFGPKRTVAWRILDAQYFGVAQRRRRLFVVASARDGFDPTEILFEFDSVRRDTPPSRQTGQEVAGTITAGAFVGGPGGKPEGAVANHLQVTTARMVAFGEYSDDGSASTLKARDYKDATDLVVAGPIMFKIRGGCDGGGKGYLGQEDQAFTLATGQDQNLFCDYEVRRLTPTECERLQSFPDGYTNVAGLSDSARYKMLGNSMCVYNMRWIGKRVAQCL